MVGRRGWIPISGCRYFTGNVPTDIKDNRGWHSPSSDPAETANGHPAVEKSGLGKTGALLPGRAPRYWDGRRLGAARRRDLAGKTVAFGATRLPKGSDPSVG